MFGWEPSFKDSTVAGGCDCSDVARTMSDILRKASEELKASSKNSRGISMENNTDTSSSLGSREGQLEIYLEVACFLLAAQTFILFYSWIWVHIPIFLPTQVNAFTKLTERISTKLFKSQDLVDSAVQMTENIAAHPKNLEAVSKAMTMVLSSDVFMGSMRHVLKQILLDREVQQIVGVSMAGISKEAMKNTFSWNPNEAEDARKALLQEDEQRQQQEKNSRTAGVIGAPCHPPRSPTKQAAASAASPPPPLLAPTNPLGHWLRGMQMVFDPHRRHARLQEEQRQQAEAKLMRDQELEQQKQEAALVLGGRVSSSAATVAVTVAAVTAGTSRSQEDEEGIEEEEEEGEDVEDEDGEYLEESSNDAEGQGDGVFDGEASSSLPLPHVNGALTSFHAPPPSHDPDPNHHLDEEDDHRHSSSSSRSSSGDESGVWGSESSSEEHDKPPHHHQHRHNSRDNSAGGGTEEGTRQSPQRGQQQQQQQQQPEPKQRRRQRQREKTKRKEAQGSSSNNSSASKPDKD